MANPTIRTATLPSSPLPPMPIDPAWIQEGRPEAGGAILMQSADKRVSSGYWECTAGQFQWTFAWDEFVHVLDGEVTIREEGGTIHVLRAGDSAHFPLGLKTTWIVTRYVRKFFVARTLEPMELPSAG
jgi:uncharacterized cupin superfamily protein